MTDTADTNIVTIVVADDHPMVRRGLIATLEDEVDFKVVGEAGSGDEAVALVRQLRPRVRDPRRQYVVIWARRVKSHQG